MHNPTTCSLRIERVVAKDNYETPARIWRHAIEAYRLDRDAHASSLNAVLPAYDTVDDCAGPHRGARYWLNPAFGTRCGGIGSALEALVWQDGCAVVALLPALLHTSWWHDYVMRADAIYYLRDKVRFSNPFLDEVQSDYFYSFVLVRWEAVRASRPAAWKPLELPPLRSEAARAPVHCVWQVQSVAPRHQAEPVGMFQCAALADASFASCEAKCAVWLF